MQSKILFILLAITLSFSAILPDRLQSFGIMAYTTVTNSGNSIIGTPASNADIGLYPGTSVTGFPPGINNGVMEITTTKAQLAQGDVTIAYQKIANYPCTVTLTPAELGGRTFAPGVYCSAAPVTLTGIMYLDTQNQTGPLWIFQLAETLTAASGAQVVFIGTPAPCNVFWNIGTSVTLGSTTSFMGIINAYTSVSFGTGASITGKSMAQTGAVTLLENALTNCVEQESTPYQCYGINSTSINVCNNQNGTCVSADNCVCRTGYSGTRCLGFSCFGLVDTNSAVCSGNGTCSGPNTCTCKSGYIGTKCTGFSCFGLVETNANVCSGNGTCSGPNICSCKTGYAGTRCDTCQSGFTFVLGKCLKTSGSVALHAGVFFVIVVILQFLF